MIISNCSRDEANNNISPSKVTNTVSSGSWHVTYFGDKDKEEASHLNEYKFTFMDSNIITAIREGRVVKGTWQTDADKASVKLNIKFDDPAHLDELSEEWQVLERTDTRIKLLRVSDANRQN